jgi:prepilin-type N-terminal cleavage/methylation domain-containing protein
MMRSAKLYRKRNGRQGFTLIELIMAIAVIGIIALPISVTLGKHVQSVFLSQDYTTALNLARLDMEQALSTDYNSLESASFSNYQGYAYDLDRNVSYAQGNWWSSESLKLVVVSVTKAGSADALVTLKTYVAKNVTSGL